jgi:hypothetical protein
MSILLGKRSLLQKPYENMRITCMVLFFVTSILVYRLSSDAQYPTRVLFSYLHLAYKRFLDRQFLMTTWPARSPRKGLQVYGSSASSLIAVSALFLFGYRPCRMAQIIYHQWIIFVNNLLEMCYFRKINCDLNVSFLHENAQINLNNYPANGLSSEE